MSDDTQPNDLDDLMARYEAVCAKDVTMLIPADIDVVIAYHRKQRARRAAGEKPSKDTAGPKVDLAKLLGLSKPAGPKITRRI